MNKENRGGNVLIKWGKCPDKVGVNIIIKIIKIRHSFQ